MPTLRLPSALLAAAFVTTVCAANAPIPASAQPVPSYATAEQTIHGRIASVDGEFNITVDDDNGYEDNVHLHHGTIINPTGLTLEPGQSVTIIGYNAGSYFEANEIDTPYNYYGERPAPVYYGAGWWYPGFPYGYGPSYRLIIIGGHPIYRPFVPVRWRGPAPEPRPYVGHPYIGRPHGHPHRP